MADPTLPGVMAAMAGDAMRREAPVRLRCSYYGCVDGQIRVDDPRGALGESPRSIRQTCPLCHGSGYERVQRGA